MKEIAMDGLGCVVVEAPIMLIKAYVINIYDWLQHDLIYNCKLSISFRKMKNENNKRIVIEWI